MKTSLRVWAAVAALIALPLAPTLASAEAPLVKTQSPGYYRAMVGDFEITALLDGTLKLPMTQLLKNATPAQLSAALKRGFVQDQVETSVNAYLVNTGKKLVLIDTGTGGSFGYTALMLDNMKAAGYKPEQVDEIYITHMHGDHVGGLLANKVAAFPNATLRMDKKDADFWLSEAMMKKAPADAQDFFKTAMAATAPYTAAGKLKTFSGATELVPGVFSMPAYGHTPGHTIYRIESKGETLVLWGDLMHVAAVQFDNPAVVITFDTDNKAAAAERMKAYKEAAAKGWLVGAAHISFPGLGHLRAANGGKSFTWVPVNYSLLK
ncbi:MAG: MBL fold metallo-hydrolase [Ramlibacter sp.]|nr:MBL fold metallo-hydrolase [Ramlibacter sp.]